MGVFNGLFPLLPGKEDEFRAFAAAVDARRDEFNASQARSGVTRETWTMVTTPTGTVVAVWFEGDIEAAFADLATADDDFTVWFRQQIQNVTGLDMAEPNDAPPPELAFDWSA